MFIDRPFISHGGLPLNWKIDCDSLTPDDWRALAAIVGPRLDFGKVHGIPRGGLAFAEALKPYARSFGTLLIVDDVLTTAGSMENARRSFTYDGITGFVAIRGVVLFSRTPACPEWITPVFRLDPQFG
jgi:hypothetical protein